jgi:hypothetical protein
MRTGHVPLNTILHRIKRADSPDCPHCQQGIKETIFHFLLACPHYAGPRRTLQAELDHTAQTIPSLLGTRTGIVHLLIYISNTKRLKSTFGEVRPKADFTLKEQLEKEPPPPRD